MAHFIHIILQGAIYSTTRRFENENDMLALLHKCLAGLSLELFFHVFYQRISTKWKLQYDIPNPFGDSRECLVSAAWVIDLDNNVLTLRKKDLQTTIRLSKFREGPVFLQDMELFEPPPLPKFIFDSDFPPPTWKSNLYVAERQTAFIGRVLEDFVQQWRHVFRSRYNNSTFCRLAMAIFRIVTLDVEVKEIAHTRPGGYGPLVWLKDLPQWESVPNHVIHLEHIPVVLTQHFTHAASAIQNDFGERMVRHGLNHKSVPCRKVTYLVLSIREVFLYKACLCGDHDHLYTKPEPLFNGAEKPSKKALEYLLMAGPQRQSSPLHNLPVEIQDMLLRESSVGPVESARLGCLLSLGSAFRWERDGRPIQVQPNLTHKSMAFPVESEIWFGSCLSGLVYR